jgi:hypothetical protein
MRGRTFGCMFDLAALAVIAACFAVIFALFWALERV